MVCATNARFRAHPGERELACSPCACGELVETRSRIFSRTSSALARARVRACQRACSLKQTDTNARAHEHACWRAHSSPYNALSYYLFVLAGRHSLECVYRDRSLKYAQSAVHRLRTEKQILEKSSFYYRFEWVAWRVPIITRSSHARTLKV